MRYTSIFTWALCLTAATACGDEKQSTDAADSGGSDAAGGTASGGMGADAGGSGGAPASGGTSSGGAPASGGASAGGSSAGGAAGDAGQAGGSAGDAASSGGSDGGTDGSVPPGQWQGCPTADEYAGDAGPHTVGVTAEATYCATFNENRTLKEELAAKAMLRFSPGEYALPGEDHEELGLPACLRLGAAAPVIPVTGGEVTYTADTFDGEVTHWYRFVQPFATNGGARRLSTELIDRALADETPSFVLDGTVVDFAAQDFIRYLTLCSAQGDCLPEVFFDSCEHPGARLHSHAVTFGAGDGTVTLELRIGESFSSTEPGAFTRASGTFRGTEFDQRDYWKLVYNPAHHHFVRNFAVIFDEPIDGACGIQVTGLEPLGDTLVPDVAAMVDCQLNETESLTVESHEHILASP